MDNLISTEDKDNNKHASSQIEFNVLKASLDDSSDKNRHFLIAFLLVELFVLVSLLGTTDEHLFLKASDFSFPFVEITVPLIGFFVLAPLILLAFHYNLLLNLLEHCKKLDAWCKHPANDSSEYFSLLPAYMINLRTQYQADRSINYHLLNLIIIFTLSGLPLFILVAALWRFGDYQNIWLSCWHYLLVLFGCFLHVVYWLRVQDFKLLDSKYNQISQLLDQFWKSKRVFWYVFFFLFIATLRIVLILMAVYSPSLLTGLYNHSPFTRELVPHLDMSGKVVGESRDATNPTHEVAQPKPISILGGRYEKAIQQDELNNPANLAVERHLKVNTTHPCGDAKSLVKLDVGWRHLNFINLTNTTLCNIDFTNSTMVASKIVNSQISSVLSNVDLRWAHLENVLFSGSSDFSRTNFTHAKLIDVRAFEANFTLVNLSDSTLLESDFTGAKFIETNLYGSVFTKVNLAYADFLRANFFETKFFGSSLYSAKIILTKNFGKTTILINSPAKYCQADTSAYIDQYEYFSDLLCDFKEYDTDPNQESTIEASLNAGFLAEDYQANYASIKQAIHPRYWENDSLAVANKVVELAKLTASTEINLQGVPLDALPKGLLTLKGIKTLNLNYSNISRENLGLIFTHLTELEELYLNRNKLTSLPENIVNLHRLRVLSLEGNDLNSLPEGFEQLADLTTVQLDMNRFGSDPSRIKNKPEAVSYDIQYDKKALNY